MVTQGTTVGSWSYTGLTTKPLWQQSGETNKGETNGYAPLTFAQMRYLNERGFRPDQYDSPIARSILTGMPKDWKPTVSKPEAPKEQPQQKPKDTPWYKTPAALWGGAALLTIGAGALAYFSGGLGSGFSAAMLTKATAMAGLAKTVAVGTGIAATAAVMASCSKEEDFSFSHTGDHKLEVNLEKRDVPVKTVEVVKEVPVEVIKEVIKEVEKIVEVPVPVEVIKEVEKIVKEYVYVEVPVEVIKEVIKEVIVEKIVEKEVIKEVPVEVIVEVEKIVEKIVEVEKIVTVEKPVYIDPEYEGEPEPVLDEINEILDPDNENRDGVTTLMNFTKDYEQQAISATLDARYCSDKQQVYAVKTRDFEDPENIRTYASHMGITKTTYNGKPAIICQVTPSFNNTTDIENMIFNYPKQKLLMFVPDKEKGLVKRYTGSVDEKGNITWKDDGEIKRDSKGRIQDSHLLAEHDGDTPSKWNQKITNFGMYNDNIFMSDLFPDEFEEAKKEEENEETQETT